MAMGSAGAGLHRAEDPFEGASFPFEKLEGSRGHRLEMLRRKLQEDGLIEDELCETATEAPDGSESFSTYDMSWSSAMLRMPSGPMTPDSSFEVSSFGQANSIGKQDKLSGTASAESSMELMSFRRMKSVTMQEAIQEEDDNAEPQDELPSLGSANHGLGDCDPCAWFWKPQGCNNGKLCRRCHLCPQEALKSRKKEKLLALRSAKPAAAGGREDEADDQEEQDMHLKSAEAQVRAMVAKAAACRDIESSPEAFSMHGPPPGLQLGAPPGLENSVVPPAGLEFPEVSVLENVAAPKLRENSDPQFSLGSETHPGECTPCSWFWKPQGCQHGARCLRCHLCGPEESKARKKAKALLRARSKTGVVDSPAGNATEDVIQSLEQPFMSPVSTCFFEDECDAEKSPANSQSEGFAMNQCDYTIGQPQKLPTEDGADPAPISAGAQYSVGAELHAAGNCQPCAWFWKPQGCMHGQDCRRCHFCPTGEVKTRRKQKAAQYLRKPPQVLAAPPGSWCARPAQVRPVGGVHMYVPPPPGLL